MYAEVLQSSVKYLDWGLPTTLPTDIRAMT